MSWKTITIYSTTVDYGYSAIDVTTITGAASVKSVALPIIYAHPEPELIGDESTTDFNNINYGVTGSFRGKFTIRAKIGAFPTANTTIATYWQVIDVLKQPYIYLYSTDYPFLANTGTDVTAVGLYSVSAEHQDENNLKYIVLEFKTRSTL